MLGAGLLGACAGERAVSPRPFQGVTYKAFEFDGRKPHGLDPTARTPVDANSDLVVEFEVAKTGAASPVTKEWQDLDALLRAVEQAGHEYARLNALTVDVSDPNQVAKVQNALRAHDEVAVQLESTLEARLGAERAEAVITGSFDGGQGGERGNFANITRYLAGEIDRLAGDIEAFTETRRRLVVSVEAFVLPRDGTVRQLHVENYDSIPAGKYEPIDRYSLDLTEAEQKDLTMRLAQAELAASAVREILDEKGELDAALRQLVDKLKEAARRFLHEVRQATSGTLQQTLRAAEDRLRSGASDPRFAAAAADLRAVADELAAIRSDAETVERLVAWIEQLPGSLQSLAAMLQAASELETRVGEVTKRIATWKPRATALTGRLGSLRTTLGEVDFAELVPAPITAFVQQLQGDVFPQTWRLVAELAALVRRSRASQGALDELAGKDRRLIFRGLDDLRPGRVELPRAGLVLGDRVQTTVTFHRVDETGAKQDVAHSERFDTEAQLMGLHRRIGAQLIFARAARGTPEATEWRPNVAIGGEYHYRIREPNDVGAVWNFLDLGLGLHAASLDQGDENVEFGLGLQASVFGGLITGGYGWNLSVSDDREYFYIGIDLFDLLLQGSKVQIGAR